MKIICVGKNYRDHAKEMRGEVPTEPLLFIKPSTALLVREKPFYYPEFSKDVHYECEVVLKICKNGKYVRPEFAMDYFDEIGLGIDFTARDLQWKCKEKGRPWEISKAFDHSAVLGETRPKENFDLSDVQFRLEKNGEVVQKDTTANMVFSYADIIVYASQFFRLQMGDYIFTGTPVGVGPVKIGDKLEGFLEDEKLLSCEVK